MTERPIQRSHDRPRLQVARADELKLPTGTACAPASTDRRPYRSSKHAVLSTLQRASAGAQGAEAATLARRALCIYRGAVRELGGVAAAQGPTVHAYLIGWATQFTCSQQLAALAAAADLGSERGLALLAESQRAQGRAERSWTAAITAAGLLRGRAPDPGAKTAAPWLEPDDEGTP